MCSNKCLTVARYTSLHFRGHETSPATPFLITHYYCNNGPIITAIVDHYPLLLDLTMGSIITHYGPS